MSSNNTSTKHIVLAVLLVLLIAMSTPLLMYYLMTSKYRYEEVCKCSCDSLVRKLKAEAMSRLDYLLYYMDDVVEELYIIREHNISLEELIEDYPLNYTRLRYITLFISDSLSDIVSTYNSIINDIGRREDDEEIYYILANLHEIYYTLHSTLAFHEASDEAIFQRYLDNVDRLEVIVKKMEFIRGNYGYLYEAPEQDIKGLASDIVCLHDALILVSSNTAAMHPR